MAKPRDRFAPNLKSTFYSYHGPFSTRHIIIEHPPKAKNVWVVRVNHDGTMRRDYHWGTKEDLARTEGLSRLVDEGL